MSSPVDPVLILGAAVPIALGAALFLLVGAFRWQFLLRHCGVAVPIRHSFRLYRLALLGNFTPLGLGRPLLAALLLRPHTSRSLLTAGLTWLLARAGDATILLGFRFLEGPLAILLPLALALLVLGLLFAEKLPLPAPQRRYPSVPALWVGLGLSLLGWTLLVAGLWLGSRLAMGAPGFVETARILAGALLQAGLAVTPHQLAAAAEGASGQLAAGGMATAEATSLVLAAALAGAGLAAATSLLGWLRKPADAWGLLRGEATGAQQHFEALATEYDAEIPDHVRARLLDRKIDAMRGRLDAAGIVPQAATAARGRVPPRGLDLGCGHGWYALALARHGYAMAGCDLAARQVAEAATHAQAAGLPVAFEVAGVDRLPFADASFDFIYSINVLHHVIDEDTRQRGWAEITRVLKPGGLFMLQEMNVRNPLFRTYMSYIFPLINRIDDGTERWFLPQALPTIPGADWLTPVEYMTFLPDFIPAGLLRRLAPLERALETSVLRPWSAHFVATLRRR